MVSLQETGNAEAGLVEDTVLKFECAFESLYESLYVSQQRCQMWSDTEVKI